NIVAEEYDDVSVESLKSLGIDDRTAERASKIRNSFKGIAVFTSVSQFYDKEGRVSQTWKLENGAENIEISGHFFRNNRIWITSNTTVQIMQKIRMDPVMKQLGIKSTSVREDQAFSFSAVAWCVAITEGIDFAIKVDSLHRVTAVFNYEGQPGEGGDENDFLKITGELRKINTKKYILGENIFEDEPIKTDKFTQKDIEIPDVGEVKLKPGTECKFNNKNSIEHWKGKIHSKINNLSNDDIVNKEKKDAKVKPESKSKVENGIAPHKEKIRHNVEDMAKESLKLRTPQAVLADRGTEFTTIVNKNSTTLKVFDGQVAFSDTKNKKTVIVKKNQMSTVKAGGVPSEPKEMDRAAKWFNLY
ncbi:MAG: hypothetical protein R6V48_08070, partial [Fidelibacterota bacterium]